jgi:chorismate synthase
MNQFGHQFRVQILGESHGKCVGVLIDGCPPGIAIDTADFIQDLLRRKADGYATTPRIEADMPEIQSGIFNEFSTGAPILITFENTNTISKDYQAIRNQPRPGHADFVANYKYNGYNDYRGGGHFSGRLTLALVAAGVVAKKILGNKIQVNAFLIEAGGNKNIEAAIENAIANQDSIGGIVHCSVNGLPVGLGEPFFDSLESNISHIVFSIPAIKAIGFGSGFEAASMTGSEHNDAIINASGTTKTNYAGGINGGISNGNELHFKVAVKPTSSTPREQLSWDNATQSVGNFTIKGRHDLCVALRVPVVVECATAIVLADMLLRK